MKTNNFFENFRKPEARGSFEAESIQKNCNKRFFEF